MLKVYYYEKSSVICSPSSELHYKEALVPDRRLAKLEWA